MFDGLSLVRCLFWIAGSVRASMDVTLAMSLSLIVEVHMHISWMYLVSVAAAGAQDGKHRNQITAWDGEG